MFKVISINNEFKSFFSETNKPASYPDGWEVFVGEEYTVIEVVDTPKGTLYILEERCEGFKYNAAKFIPLSNINELELTNNSIKEFVYEN